MSLQLFVEIWVGKDYCALDGKADQNRISLLFCKLFGCFIDKDLDIIYAMTIF